MSVARGEGSAFFSQVIDLFHPSFPCRLLVITHFLSDRPLFLEAVSRVSSIEALLPIPYSTNPRVLAVLREAYPVFELSLDKMVGGSDLLALARQVVSNSSVPLGILEIGGYFASIGNRLRQEYNRQFLGAVEDTESGHRRYASQGELLFPVVSIARSRLKLIEDRFIGCSVAFSLERLLRATGRILTMLTVGILGYGRVGASVARSLAARECSVIVYDSVPGQRALALAEGFSSLERQRLLERADVIVGATGVEAVSAKDFERLKDGVVLVSATSKRMEFDVDGLYRSASEIIAVAPDVERLRLGSGKVLYLIASGQPVNFLDDAVVGPAIYLTQAALLAGLKILTDNPETHGILEIPEPDEDRLADIWLAHFADRTGGGGLVQSSSLDLDGPA